ARAGRLAVRLGVPRVPRVVVDELNYGPLVSGWWRPQIVLPRCLVGTGDQEEIDLALAHELIHVRRGDTVISVLQQLACAIWWFHPLVWWANRVMNRTTELCCDEEVIASLGCKPVRYARCLVEIAAQKQQMQHVAMVPGTRPAAITASRLSRLGKPSSAFLRRTPWSCWFVFLLITVLVVPARTLRTQATAEEPKVDVSTPQPEVATGEPLSKSAAAALAKQDYGTAVAQYRKIVTDNPHSGLAWYRLGYALHAMGELEEAIEAHRRAMEFAPTRATATYNLACALALQGKRDEAMTELEAAIDAGFRARQRPLGTDPDLAALLDHPQFSALAARAAEVATSPYRQLDFMVGDWQVHNADGQLLGHSTISKEEEGFLLREKWRAAGGSTGTGITYFHPKEKVWRQTFVGMFGSVIDMQGDYQGDALRMSGETALPNATVSLVRASTTPQGDGTFQFLMEESRDGGESWQTTFDGLYSPR
ncbi:MAG: M56 family metallopeptidase, partial [Planctomycetota bacterium]